MNSRLLQLLLGLSLLLNTFVLVGFVYRSWIAPPIEMGHPALPAPQAGTPRPSPIESMVHELNLDDSQRQILRGLFDQYAATRRERLHEIQRLREQTAAELRSPSLDMAKIDGLVDQVSRLRAEQQKETLRTFVQLEPKLRPEQRERMQKVLADRFVPPPPAPRPPAGGPPRPPQ